MHFSIHPSDHGNVVLNFSGDRRQSANVPMITLPMLALALGTGKGAASAANLIIDQGQLELNDGHGVNYSEHERLQVGMGLWLSCNLDEDIYRQAVSYPKLLIERDTSFPQMLRVCHAGTTLQVVAMIPNPDIFNTVSEFLEQDTQATFEGSGVEVTLRRTGMHTEITTRYPEGDLSWLATPRELEQLRQHIKPQQSSKPPERKELGFKK